MLVMSVWERCAYTVGLWRLDESTMFNGGLRAPINETMKTLILRWGGALLFVATK